MISVHSTHYKLTDKTDKYSQWAKGTVNIPALLREGKQLHVTVFMCLSCAKAGIDICSLGLRH